MSGHFELALDREGYRPGSPLSLRIAVAEAQHVILELVWETSGKGSTDRQVVERREVDLSAGGAPTTVTFSLPEGPHSFSGSLVSLQWSVEVRVFDGDPAVKAFTMGPEGHEVRLPQLEQEKFKRPWWKWI